ncbi:MAG: FAD-dependent oxidoreductase [Clostridia bacterium]|nr:FAD-dependent oxidoreductase [Clostridia bacterium]MBR6479975.1 FAD-dependent oxidoreductase [Clostridia bacterium]MBR6512098.1 FAD-dependent oxidoreductase [Clostridia bacterium]
MELKKWLLASKIDYVNKIPNENSACYRFIDSVIDDEYAGYALKLKRRKPVYIAEFAKRINKSEEEAYKIAEHLCNIGITEWTSDDDGREMINLPLYAPGSMELMLMPSGIHSEENTRKAGRAFFDEARFLTEILAPWVPMGRGLIKVVPVQKAIENEPKRVKIEELSYWVDKYKPSLGVTQCQCRRAAALNGEGTGDPADEVCIVLGKFAESCIKTNRARRITEEECWEILRRSEELGYVHEVTNVDGEENSMFICNCSWDTCLGLRTAWWCSTPNMSRSNYVASVNTDNCVACGQCMEVCPQNAVKLGEKLCRKNPVPIKDKDLPDNIWWSKKYWQTDFLTNRQNVIPETGTSPCKTACPAHIAVQGYLKLASEGRYVEALELIKKENPLPAVCGAICNHRCEDECTRGSVDDAVAIDEVKKFIAMKELDDATKYIPKKMYTGGQKIAVIGSGPAGLSCAYYLSVYGHQVTVFEKEDKLGGMLTLGIPSFRLEKNVVDAEIEVIKALGVEFKTGVEVGKDISIADLRKEGYKGFYIAIGAQNGRALGITGEDAEGVISGVEFLKAVNAGKKTKAAGKVVVIGGGNVAVDVARTAVRQNITSVNLYCLESEAEMPAAKEEQDEAREENIVINNGWGPKEILLKDGKVSGVVFKKCVSVFEAGKFSPKYDENDTITVDADTVLLSIGQSIDWGDLLKGTKVKINKNGTAVADGFTYVTDDSDIFVGGDVYTGPKFAIDAIAAGKQGAVSLNRAVREGHSLVLGRDRRDYKAIDKDNALLPLGGFDLEPRQIPQRRKESKLSFADDRLTFTEEQVKKETARCLSCGAAHVDQNICVGCGLCTTRCKFDAIHLSKVYNAGGGTYEELIPTVAKYAVVRSKNMVVTKLKGE